MEGDRLGGGDAGDRHGGSGLLGACQEEAICTMWRLPRPGAQLSSPGYGQPVCKLFHKMA